MESTKLSKKREKTSLIIKTTYDPTVKNVEWQNEPIAISLGDVEEETLDLVRDAVVSATASDQPVLPIYVSSYGGLVYAAQAIIEEINGCSIPVATIAQGKAMSAGAMILGSGTIGYRYSSPDVAIMLHDLSAGVFGKQSEIEATSKHYKKINRRLWRKLAKHCGHKDRDYFLRLVSKKNSDLYLTAKQALKHKLIDHIGCPKLEAQVKVKYRFE